MARWWEDESTLDQVQKLAQRWASVGLRLPVNQLAPRPTTPQPGGPGGQPTAPMVGGPTAPQATPWAVPQPQRPVGPGVRLPSGFEIPLPVVMRGAEPTRPGGWMPPAWRDWAEDWERIKAESFPAPGAPQSPAALAEWRARQEELRQAGAYPGLSGAAAPQPGVSGALWQDVKQLPILGPVAGAVEAVGRVALRALDVPAQTLENVIGAAQAVGQQLPVPEPARAGVYPRLGQQAALAQEVRGEPVQRSSLVDALTTEGIDPEQARAALYQASRITYSGPEAMLAAARRIIAGEDARVVTEGKAINLQNPTAEDVTAYRQFVESVVARGGTQLDAEELVKGGRIPGEADVARELVGQVAFDPLNVFDWLSDARQVPRAAARARAALGVTDVGRVAGAAIEAAPEVGRLVGAAPEVGRAAGAVLEAGEEAAGLIPGVVRTVGEGAALTPQARVAAYLQQAGEAHIDDIIRETGLPPQQVSQALTMMELGENVRPLGAMRYGLPPAQAVQDVARQADVVKAATMAAAPQAERGWVGRVWDRINPFALTDETRARQAVNDAVEISGTVIADARSGDEAAAILRQFVDNPQALEGVLGSVPEWTQSQRARDTLRAVMDKLDDMPSMKAVKAGEAWNPARFILDVDGLLDEATAIPATSQGMYRTLAENYKGLMSEFYLRTPGYALPNAMGDLSTMANDGLLTFDKWSNVDDFYTRFGPTTSRMGFALRGGTQGAAQAAEIGKKSRLGALVGSIFGEQAGQVVGGASESIGRFMGSGVIAGRRTILGEETRYARAHYAALQRALAEVWRPTIPDEIAQLLGPGRAAALGDTLRRAVNGDEMAKAVARATSTTAGGLFDYGRLLGDQADELNLEILRVLDDGLRGATSADDVGRVFDNVLGQLDTELGRVVAGDPLPPIRRMNTTAATMQDAAEDAAALEKLGRLAGWNEDKARALQTMVAEVAQMEAETARIESAVMAQAGDLLHAGQVDGKGLARALQDVRSRTWDLQAETRAAVDKLRREVGQRINALRQNKALSEEQVYQGIERLWNQYYSDVRRMRGDEQTTVRQMLGVLQENLTRGQVPEIAEDAARARVAALRGRQETLRGRQERLAGLHLVENVAEDDPQFAQRLEQMRVAVDSAQMEGWRTAMVNPSRDALDIITQAERDVQAYGAAAAAKHEEIYQMWRATWGRKGAMSKEEFRALVDPVWAESFRQQTGRFDMARRELMALPMGDGAMGRMLQELGWPMEAAQGLSRDTAALVLRERIPWDAALGEPALPMAQLEEWTLEGLAKALGIDATDARMIDAGDWRRIAEHADRQARVYESLALDANAFFNVAGGDPQGARAGLAVVDALRQARAGDPGFNQRMEQGARLLREIADGAWARTSLSGRVGAAVAIVPEGAQIVTRAKRGDVWLVRVQGGGQTLAEVGFDNPADALREVKRLETEIARGAGIPASWVPRDLMDAAARFGVDEGSPDEWRRLAEIADSRGTDWLMVGDEYGQGHRAAQEAMRLPEDITRTIYNEEVTARAGRLSAREEQRVGRELAKEGTAAADAYVGQLLEMMGVTNFELGKLDLTQRRKLLEEIAAGGVIETATGGARQIDGLTPERRTRIIEAAAGDANLVRLAQGAAADPRTALGYEWLSVAEQARARAETLDLVTAGIIGAEDIPAAMADADARRALMEALEEMRAAGQAEVRAAQDSVAGVFATVDDEVEEATRRLIAGGMEPGEAIGLAAAAEGDAAARAALLERAMSEGGMTVEEVIRAGQAAGSVVEPPTMAEMADVVVNQQRRLLERLRAGMVGEWDGMQQTAREGVPVWARNRARQWAQGDLQKQWSEARAVAVRTATQMADDALLDYTKRRRFDTWLALVTPYSYWRTRSAKNWAIRLAQQPGTLARYMRYKAAMQKFNEERGYRGRFEGSVEIPTGEALPEWMGGGVFVNPSSMFFPFEGLEASDWEDPAEAQNGVEWLYKTLSKYGFRPHGFLDMGLKATGLVDEEAAPGERVNPLAAVATGTPQARMIQATRALMQGQGAGPVGGIFGGGPQMQPWESYRVARMLSNMAGDQPGLTADILLAQEIMRRVATGELSPNEAIGRESSANLDRIAREAGWTAEDIQTGQALLGEAWRRTQQEQAIPSLTSGLLGQSARIYPSGERAQVDLQAQMYGAGYSPLTGQGSRAEYEAMRAARPESYARGVARQFVPGEVDPYAEWTPQAARGTILYKPEKAAGLAQLETAGLDALRAEGLWSRAGLQTARDAYTTAMEETRARLGMGEYNDTGVFAARYGSTPAEAASQAQEAVLQAVSNARPRRGDYTVKAEYDAALQSFYSALKAGNLEEAGVTLPQNLPQTALDYARTVDRTAIEGLWRENDTLAEALATAFDEWYGNQWEAYRIAAGPAVSPGLNETMKQARYDRREKAWQQFVEAGARVSEGELVRQMQALYGGRFSATEIRAAVKGMQKPTLLEAWEGRMTPEELADRREGTAMSEAKDAFWEAYRSLPQGAKWSETKGQPIVAVLLDRDTRGTGTREQYEMASAVLRSWLAANGYPVTGRQETVDGRQGGTGAGTTARTGGTYTTKKVYAKKVYAKSGGGGYAKKGGGGGQAGTGEGGLPRALSDWATARQVMSGPLRRQVEAFLLRGTALDEGGMRELTALAQALGWRGTMEELLRLLAGVFKARVANVGTPSGSFRNRGKYLGRVTGG